MLVQLIVADLPLLSKEKYLTQSDPFLHVNKKNKVIMKSTSLPFVTNRILAAFRAIMYIFLKQKPRGHLNNLVYKRETS